jgi:hypothetical protein
MRALGHPNQEPEASAPGGNRDPLKTSVIYARLFCPRNTRKDTE